MPIDNDDPYFDDSFDTAYDFCDRLCREDFGEIIDRAFAAVEERIHAKLPEEAKQIAKYAFLARQTDLGEVLRGERQRPGDRNKATGTIEEENIFAQLQSLIGDITITEQRECVDEIVETYKENSEHDKDHEDKDEK